MSHFYLAIVAVSAAILTFSLSAPAAALTVGGGRDCDDNAVIHCGALSTDELQQKYNDSDDVQRIFSHFGLRQSHMDSIDEKAVAGQVHSDNTVTVNGKVVATDVVTLGRQNMPGSTGVSYRNGTFYKRPPSVSFASSSLPAFVVMNNGKFGYAVIASCGNPVIKKQEKKPDKQPEKPAKPEKEVVKEEKQPEVKSSSKAQATAVASASVTNVYNAPPSPPPAKPAESQPAPTPSPTPQSGKEQPRELPNTGPGSALSIAGTAGLLSGIGHFIYKRRFS